MLCLVFLGLGRFVALFVVGYRQRASRSCVEISQSCLFFECIVSSSLGNGCPMNNVWSYRDEAIFKLALFCKAATVNQ